MTSDPFKLPTWTILVPTIGERRVLFERLMSVLLPQTEAWTGRVLVTGWLNDGTPALPVIRQRLIESAATDYVSFIDDDDLVPEYFVHEVMTALSTWPDYVGFQVQCYSDGTPIAVAYHSLQYRRWRNLPGRFERDISHINPVKTVHARRGSFARTKAGGAEDRDWAAQLRRARVLKNEIMIDKIMYHYLYSTSTDPGQGSRWQNHRPVHASAGRADIDHPNFAWSLHDIVSA